MKIALGTVEVSDDQRAAIAFYYGDEGLATRERCRNFIIGNGYGAIDAQQSDLSDTRDRAER